MAQQPPSRRLIYNIFRNFINSLKPRQISGTLIGTDYFGTKYYEIPADLSRGKKKPSRWFIPKTEENFQQELPAEWESWLRFRRNEPPTEDEILKNLAIMDTKKKNALEIEMNAGKPSEMLKGPETFPKRPEYEVTPGKPRNTD